MDVKQHCPGRVGDVRRVHFSSGKLVDQPGVHGPKQDLAPFRPAVSVLDMIQHPFDLRPAEIRIDDKTCLLPDHLRLALTFQLFTDPGRPPALPYDGGTDRFACFGVPQDRGLPLVRDPDRLDLFGIDAAFFNNFLQHIVLAAPDLVGVVLHPAVLRIILRKLFLCHRHHASLTVKQDRAGTGRSLIRGKNIIAHEKESSDRFLLPPILRKNSSSFNGDVCRSIPRVPTYRAKKK